MVRSGEMEAILAHDRDNFKGRGEQKEQKKQPTTKKNFIAQAGSKAAGEKKVVGTISSSA